jgi:hypothetical protein
MLGFDFSDDSKNGSSYDPQSAVPSLQIYEVGHGCEGKEMVGDPETTIASWSSLNEINANACPSIDSPRNQIRYRILNSAQIGKHSNVPAYSMLHSRGVYLFDYVNEVFIWIGKKSEKRYRKFAVALLRKLLRNQTRPSWLHIQKIIQDHEPLQFKLRFLDWLKIKLTPEKFCIRPLPLLIKFRDEFSESLRDSNELFKDASEAEINELIKSAKQDLKSFSVFLLSPKGKCTATSENKIIPLAQFSFYDNVIFLAIYDIFSPAERTDSTGNPKKGSKAIIYAWKGCRAPHIPVQLFRLQTWPKIREALHGNGCQFVELCEVHQGQEPLILLAHLNQRMLLRSVPRKLMNQDSPGTTSGTVSNPCNDTKLYVQVLFEIQLRHCCVAVALELPKTQVEFKSSCAYMFQLTNSQIKLIVGKEAMQRHSSDYFLQFVKGYMASRNDPTSGLTEISTLDVLLEGTVEAERVLVLLNRKLNAYEWSKYLNPHTCEVFRIGVSQIPDAPNYFAVRLNPLKEKIHTTMTVLYSRGVDACIARHPDECMIIAPLESPKLHLWVGRRSSMQLRGWTREVLSILSGQRGDASTPWTDLEDLFQIPHARIRVPPPSMQVSQRKERSAYKTTTSSLPYSSSTRPARKRAISAPAPAYEVDGRQNLSREALSAVDEHPPDRDVGRILCIHHQGYESEELRTLIYPYINQSTILDG